MSGSKSLRNVSRALLPNTTPKGTAATAITKPKPKPKARRSRKGCLSCKKLKIKCTEDKPFCEYCVHTKRQCVYPDNVIIVNKQKSGSSTDTDLSLVPSGSSSSSTPDLEGQFMDLNNRTLLINSTSYQMGVSNLELKLLKFYLDFGADFFSVNINENSHKFWSITVPNLWCSSDLVKNALYAVSSVRLLANYDYHTTKDVFFEVDDLNIINGPLLENPPSKKSLIEEAFKYMRKTQEMLDMYQMIVEAPGMKMCEATRDLIGQLLIAKKLNTGSRVIFPSQTMRTSNEVQNFALLDIMTSTNRFLHSVSGYFPTLKYTKYESCLDPEIIPDEAYNKSFKNLELNYIKHLTNYVNSKFNPTDVLHIIYLDAIMKLLNGCHQAMYFSYPIALFRAIVYMSADMDFINLLKKKNHTAMKIMFYSCCLNAIFHYKLYERSGIHNEFLEFYRDYSVDNFKDRGGWEDEIDKNLYDWVIARSKSLVPYDMNVIRYLGKPVDEVLNGQVELHENNKLRKALF